METSVILLLSFITLVGLQLCVPDGDIEKMADNASLGCPWCPSPILKMLYGIIQLIGVAFIIIMVLYMTFAKDWWYFLVYIGGVILSKIGAIIFHIPLIPLFKKYSMGVMYGGLRVKRFVGCLLVLCCIIMCFICYVW